MRTENTAAFPKPALALAVMACLLLAACAAPTGAAKAQEGLVSTMELMEGIVSIDGIRIVKPADMPGTVYTEDYGTSQVLEIIRPDMGPIVVGRLGTSCSCIRASMDGKSFARGERAFIEVRNVKQSPPNGATYAVWAQLASPYRANLQFEVFVQSDRQPGDPVPVAPVAVPAEATPAVPAESAPVAGDAPEPAVPAGGASSSAGGPPFRYEDIAPYKPKSSEERLAAETAAGGAEAGDAAASEAGAN